MNFPELTNAVLDLIDKAELTPSERANLAGDVKHKLDVPGTIWSPEDFEDSLRDQLEMTAPDVEITDELMAELCDASFELYDDSELTDSDWDAIREVAADLVNERFAS